MHRENFSGRLRDIRQRYFNLSSGIVDRILSLPLLLETVEKKKKKSFHLPNVFLVK